MLRQNTEDAIKIIERGTADHIAFLTLMTLILLPTVSMVVKAGLEPVEDSDRLVL